MLAEIALVKECPEEVDQTSKKKKKRESSRDRERRGELENGISEGEVTHYENKFG